MRVGAVIDLGFRTDGEAASLSTDAGVHVLGCHEIENVFLDPEGLAVLLDHVGKAPDLAEQVVRHAGDRFAGLWIAERAVAGWKGFIPKEAKTVLSGLELGHS